ncbi:FecR family protein [Pedobacter sp. KACC 23697]|uniref:FecR family protein n=1 Tax=Pedobacter sp. KACC 23697 TaxID=3149230 RepID=A0AAU7K9B8_9SPHI
MNEIKERIDKLWSNEISVEEQHKLLESLGKDSAGLKSDLKTSYDLELSTGGKEITEKRFEHILARLHARMDDQEIKPIAKIFPLYHWLKMVAALLIVALITVLYFSRNHAPQQKQLADTDVEIEKVILRQPYNSGQNAMIINLSDGSQVTLQPQSSLSYYEPFDRRSRNISMKGEATFKVAKDKHHPFIVSANGFTTTALGTEFTINTHKKDRVNVKLIEGKVVVKAGAESSMKMSDVYLIAGEQLSINTRLKVHSLISFKDSDHADKPKPILLKIAAKDTLLFNETPLSVVFSRLAKRYDTDLAYEGIEETELQKLYFTGSVGAAEKLNTILPVICNMNGLTFKLTAKSIIISKQK